MEHIRSRLVFDSRQRSGIVVLVLLICAGLAAYHFLDFSEEDLLDISSPEIVSLRQAVDSLRALETEKKKPKRYPFNPNYLTDFKAYTLGMTPVEFDRLTHYRNKGKWINSASDFQKVTGVSDSLLDSIQPYFKFPEWVTQKRSYTRKMTEVSPRKPLKKKDLNTATAEELRVVYGIGAALGERIVKYRNRLGGFTHESQLYDVYGLSEEVVARTLEYFEVSNPMPIAKMNINRASASDIATIPGVSFELAQKIWNRRRDLQRVDSLAQLGKIEGLSERKLQLIALYLSTD